MVIVWKLDRFARNRYDSARYKATLKKNGVKVVPAPRLFPTGPRVLIWKAGWKGKVKITPPDCPRR